VVARIAPEPVNTNVAVADYRVRSGNADARPQTRLQDSPLPPVPEPVPTPVPAPAIPPPSQAFVAALASENLPVRPADTLSALRRFADRWSPPPSSLKLTDRLV
jgi:hypothetical protein